MQKATATILVTAKQFAQGFMEIPLTWPTAFPNTTYVPVTSFLNPGEINKLSARNAYIDQGHRDKSLTGIVVVVGIGTGARVGDTIIASALAE
jgi:hypothetical protein